MVVATAHEARGEPTRDALTVARQTFQSGLALETAGDYAGALTRFAEVVAVKTSPQVRFHIARCQEQLGRWTEALGSYQLGVDEARAAGENDVASEIDQARRALDRRVPKLSLVRGAGASTAAIALDGVTLGAASLGVVLRVDPGPHVVRARGDERAHDVTVTLAPGDDRTYAIELPAATAARAVSPGPAGPRPIERPGGGGPPRALGYALGAAGLAALGLGAVFVVLRQKTIDDLEGQCVARHCDPSLSSTASHGKLDTGLALGSFVLGAAGVTTGVVILARPSPATSVGAGVGQGAAGVSWLGRF